MARGCLKQGSLNAGGGLLLLGCPTVTINGRMAGRQGDLCTPHPFKPFPPKPVHPPNPIVLGNFKVTVGGRAIARIGDFELFRHPYILGSFNVVTG